MTNEDRTELYINALKARGTITLSLVNAEVFARAKPPAEFGIPDRKTGLVRVTRLTEAVRP